MAIDRRRFWLLFLGASALFALGSEFLPADDQETDAWMPVHAAPHRPAVGESAFVDDTPTPVIEFPASRRVPAGGAMFRGKSFAAPPPPPPPPPPPAPPPPPRVPQVPFKYVGKLLEGGVLRAYVSLGDRLIAVHPGDVIDQQYRIDSVEAREIRLTYLPLNARQSIAAGAAL